MSIKVGSTAINKLYLGGSEINKAYLGNALIFDNTSVVDSLMLSGIVSYWNSNSIDPSAVTDGDSIGVWADVISGNDAIQEGTLRPVLLIGPDGKRQVNFNGGKWLNVGTPSNLDFQNGIDSYSLVLKQGSRPASGIGTFFSKSVGTASLRQYQFFYTDGYAATSIIGGANSSTTNKGPSTTPIGNELTIYNVGTTLLEMWHKGIKEFSSEGVIGTNQNTTQDINIGCRTNGGFVVNASIEFLAVYNRLLTESEITAIINQYQV